MELRIFFPPVVQMLLLLSEGSSEGIKLWGFCSLQRWWEWVGEYLNPTNIFWSQFEIRRRQLFSRSPFIHFTHPHIASNTCKVDRLLVMRHMDTTSQLKHLQRRGWGGNPGVPIPTTLFLRVPDYTFLCTINNSAITLIGCIFVDTGVDKGRLWWEDFLLSVQFYTTFFRCALIPTLPPPHYLEFSCLLE